MNSLRILAGIAAIAISAHTTAAEGLLMVKSPYGPEETMDRLETEVKDRGLNVFARIDHAAGAARIGKSLRPTELLIFGNPKGGTPFMECAQSVGIDLPLKAMVLEDVSSTTLIAYNDPVYLAQRHGVAECGVVPNLQKALEAIVESTVAD